MMKCSKNRHSSSDIKSRAKTTSITTVILNHRSRPVGIPFVNGAYAWRGGPLFWTSDEDFPEGSAKCHAALAATAEDTKASKGQFGDTIIRYLASGEFRALSPRYKSDIETSIRHPENGIDAKFGSAPIAAFNRPRIRQVVMDWRDRIGGKTGDVRREHLVKIVAWAHDRGELDFHHLKGIKRLHKSNRAEIVWTDDEVARFVAGAPEHVGRIVIVATQTGLRPGDLFQLSAEHVEATPGGGRRIVIMTRKKQRKASIPVTPQLAAVLDAMPADRERVLTTERGTPWNHENYLGDAVSEWRDRLGLRKELRLYDCRGTAITRLFLADATLREIATATGWSIANASTIIERYMALRPEMADSLAAKLAASVK